MFDKTVKLCSECQHEAMNLLNEEENPLDYYAKDKSYWKKFLYFCLMVYRGINKNRCFVRSSALSYATLLALVPMLALIISIAAGLLKTESGEQQIAEFTGKAISFVVPQLNLLGNQELLGTNTPAPAKAHPGTQEKLPTEKKSFTEDQLDKTKVAEYISSLVNNVRGGALGVTGFVSLIMVVILLLTKIEEAFNDIWQVDVPRGWSMRVLNYWGIITLGPIMMFVALSLFGSDKIQLLQKLFGYIPGFGDILYKHVLLKSLPWFLMICCFTLLYYFMPSTKVRWSAALVGGTFTGILWQLNSTYSVVYASSVVSYSKMYGLLAAIPILLVGLYFSWMVVLLGCQVSFVWQNRRAYVQNKLAKTIGQKDKELGALRIMVAMGRRMDLGQKPLSIDELSSLLMLPRSLVVDVLERFVDAGLAVQSNEEGFVPNLSLDKLSCYRILSAVCLGKTELSWQEDNSCEQMIAETYRSIRTIAQDAAEKITVRDILKKEEPQC